MEGDRDSEEEEVKDLLLRERVREREGVRDVLRARDSLVCLGVREKSYCTVRLCWSLAGEEIDTEQMRRENTGEEEMSAGESKGQWRFKWNGGGGVEEGRQENRAGGGRLAKDSGGSRGRGRE